MTTTNAIIGFPSAKPYFTTLTGGSWNSNYPLSNLESLPLSRVARSSDLSTSNTVIISTTSGATRRVGIVGLARHNFSVTATIRTRLYADSSLTTLLYDSGVENVWPAVYPYSTREWEDDNYWTGTYNEDDLLDTTWLWIKWFGRDYLAAGIRIDISDPSNVSGYVQAGYLEIAAQQVLQTNPQWGAQYGYRFRSEVTEAQGGAKYTDRKIKPRVYKGTIQYASRDEALATHLERYRQFDLDRPLLWFPHPDEPQHWIRTAMLAQHVEPGLFSYLAAGRDAVPIALEEVIG